MRIGKSNTEGFVQQAEVAMHELLSYQSLTGLSSSAPHTCQYLLLRYMLQDAEHELTQLISKVQLETCHAVMMLQARQAPRSLPLSVLGPASARCVKQ